MRIDCPSCARTYLVSHDALGPEGRYLVCQLCETRWLATPQDGVDDEDVAPAIEDTFAPDEPDLAAPGPELEPAPQGTVWAADGAPGPAGDQDEAWAGEIPAEDILAGGILDHDRPDGLHGTAGIAGDAGTDRWWGSEAENPLPPVRTRREARPKTKRAPGQRGFLAPAAGLAACFILAMAMIGKREAIAQAVPGTRVIYAAIGLPVPSHRLEFGTVTTARLDGGTSITVSGTIHNPARQRANVPRLSFDIRDASGAIVTHKTENPPKHSLGAQETLAFAATIPVPEGSADVAVHFSNDAPSKSLRDLVGPAPAK